jgi:RND family efflux transporter MFP subunit
VASVKEGADVSFTVSAFPGRKFTGKVRFVSGALRASTRDLIAEALVSNSERLLLPGMFADVELVIGAQKLPSVPERALTEQDEQSRLFAVVGGRLEERIVAVGPRLDGRVAITRGVTENDRVVVSDLAGLSNGRKVR